jgi:hypothetical protein
MSVLVILLVVAGGTFVIDKPAKRQATLDRSLDDLRHDGRVVVGFGPYSPDASRFIETLHPSHVVWSSDGGDVPVGVLTLPVDALSLSAGSRLTSSTESWLAVIEPDGEVRAPILLASLTR